MLCGFSCYNYFDIRLSELPDFLPLFLEFASTREPGAAIELIGQPADVIAALRERLAKRDSPYEAVMAALLVNTSLESRFPVNLTWLGLAGLILAAGQKTRGQPG